MPKSLLLLFWISIQLSSGLNAEDGSGEEVMSPEKLAEFLKTKPDLWKVSMFMEFQINSTFSQNRWTRNKKREFRTEARTIKQLLLSFFIQIGKIKPIPNTSILILVCYPWNLIHENNGHNVRQLEPSTIR